ncbi:MAG TPA: undecaprenyldiphospho-muramoylpentapeptide beta-N-acetylglucosaminyltransferase [Candidatus Bathyarchaeia archaeon]|nr:undecaprenyldiphospho-muramoylpentapeptide beta-N-acetylglucosaminyltransferase [Candidatus Bathyarchaeia archaeon]
MRIMITGGGTGGHTSPAVAIIEELQKRDPRLAVQWVGRRGGIEQRVAQRTGTPFRSVPVEGWPRKKTLRRAWVAGKVGVGILRSVIYITRFKPQVVVGVGGFVSLPLCYAAQRMGIPTVLHEQNKRLGMANQMLAPRANRILLSYPDTLGQFPREKSLLVGNPVRAGFIRPPGKLAARESLGLEAGAPTVLVSGGSQGARSINEAMLAALAKFEKGEAQFIWMTGASDAPRARAAAEKSAIRAEVFPFIDDMPAACAAADLIVSRAGASSAAEIAVLGKPSILVPYPHATDNHQDKNAAAFVEVGAAVLLADAECSGDRLAGLLRELLGDPARLAAMAKAAGTLAKPGAAEAIVEQILMLAFQPKNAEE